MKFLEKLSLFLFSLILCVISIGLILIMLKIVQIEAITGMMAELLNIIIVNDVAVKITLAVSAVILILAIKCIFFGEEKVDDGRNGVTLENDAGKLVISKESLENLIANVVKDVQGIEATSSRTILDKDRNLVVYVTTLVSKDMMIKDVTMQIQQKIKEALVQTADLQVKQVNVKVKNITNKKIKGLPPAAENTAEETNVDNETNSENE